MSAHPPETVAPGLRVVSVRSPTLPPATHTNTWVVGRERLTVIDPASPYPEEQERLHATLARWGTVERVVLTHHHHDHIGGVAVFADAGIPVFAHPATGQRVRFHTHPLDHGDTVTTDRGPLQVHHTPGHAPGHIVLQTDDGFIVAGDMVAGTGTIAIDPGDDGHLATYLQSLATLQTLAPVALLPAHGPVLAEPMVTLAHYIAHRNARTEQFCEAFDGADATALDLARRVYTELPARFHALAAVQVSAHLVHLEEQGRVSRTGDRWVLTQ